MSILEKNIEKYGVNFSSSHYEVGDLLNGLEEQFLFEPDFDLNKTLFIAYELTSIEQILKLVKGLNEKSAVFLYYRDEKYLYELLSKVDFTDKEDYRIIFFAGDYTDTDKINKLNILLQSFLYSFSNLQAIIKKSEDIGYIRSAKEFLAFVSNIRENYVFLLGNDLNDTLYGVRNRLLNIPTYVANPGLKEFKERYGHIYKNKPAVIVSSGPSLDKNVHHLKAFQDKALILSCDGSLSTLERHGIKPDIIGSVERIYKTYEAFYKDRDIDPDIVFSGPAVVRPEIVSKFDGQKILSIFKSKDVYGSWINDITLGNKGTIWAGSSVAHLLMNLADEFGCDPIILIGQDLAYSLEGISHAGDAEVKESVDTDKVTEWVKDYNGNDIPSTIVWKKFLHTFEDMVRCTNKTVIDATEGGALITGTQIRKLKEVLEAHCTSELPTFREVLDNITVEEAYINAARESSFKGINKSIGIFNELLEKVKEGIGKNKKSFSIIEKGIQNQKQLDGIYDTLDFVDGKIVKEIAMDAFLMMLFQYPIYTAAKSINNLKTDKYTMETLRFNLIIHRELLDLFNLYINKMIKVLINGLKDNRGFFSSIEEYDNQMDSLNRQYDYLFKTDKYDTPLT